MQTLRKMKILTVCSIQTSIITFKHITEAQMYTSCRKLGHLDKTRTAVRWDIWRCSAQMHKYSVIACIWVKFAMQTLSKMKNFTVCSILTNTDKHSRSTNVRVLPKDKICTALRWDILQWAAQIFSYCLHLGPIRNADAKQDENPYCMLHTDKHNYI